MWSDQQSIGEAEIFTRASNKTWLKKDKCAWVYILFIGTGSSGGTGFADILGGAAGGGGGGGSGPLSRLLFPAAVVPHALRFEMGRGGETIAGNGANGSRGGASSIIGLGNNVTLFTHLATDSGAGGAGGTAVSGGTPGGVGAAPANTAWTMSGWPTHSAGLGGSGAGGLAGAGGDIIVAQNTVVTGGAGGGGAAASYAGGISIDAFSRMTIQGGTDLYDLVAGITSNMASHALQKPLSFFGGAGGNGNNLGAAGMGMQGGFGSGGGGGGGVNNGVVGLGYGGRGGDAIAMVWSW